MITSRAVTDVCVCVCVCLLTGTLSEGLHWRTASHILYAASYTNDKTSCRSVGEFFTVAVLVSAGLELGIENIQKKTRIRGGRQGC